MSQEPLRRAVVTVLLPEGLHLRPLTLLSRAAQRYTSAVTLRKGDQVVDAKRAIDLMMLAAMCGEQLELEARGVDAEQACEEIIRLFESGFSDDEGN